MPNTIQVPAGFAPLSAMGFGAIGSDAIAVDAAHPLPAADANSAAIAAPGAVTPSDSATFAAPRLGLTLLVSVAGNVALAFGNGATMVVPVLAGVNVLPFAPVQIKATGTTATAMYFLNN